jgi:hypothetical protein
VELRPSPEFYRYRSVEMKKRAARAETAYLEGCYLSIAD